MFEIRKGMRVTFDHDGEQLVGLVNGDPYVVAILTEKGAETGSRIPVHVTELNENIDVAGPNIVNVEPL